MDISYARMLFQELSKKECVPHIDDKSREDMIGFLTEANPTGTVTKLPERHFVLADCYHDESCRENGIQMVQRLTLSSLIKNHHMVALETPMGVRIVDGLRDLFSIYDHDSLVRGMMRDKDLVKIFSNCAEYYSLLGLYELRCDGAFVAHSVTQPLLIVPGISECGSIYREIVNEWEQKHSFKFP